MSATHNFILHTILFSTLSERIKHTPASPDRVIWPPGQRGEGLCIPKCPKIIKELKKYHLTGIYYVAGIAFFTPCALIHLSNLQLTLNRNQNFATCNRICAEKWNQISFEGCNNWTTSSVKNWIKKNKYTWHECNDMHSCELIPRCIRRCEIFSVNLDLL